MLKQWITFCILLMASVVWAGGDTPYPDEVYKCPFEWSRVKGMWSVEAPSGENYFELNVLFETSEGAKYFSVSMYDTYGQLKAYGRGYALSGERAVRATLYPAHGSMHNSGYGLVMTNILNPQRAKFGDRYCQPYNTLTFMSLKPLNCDSCKQRHYLLR